MFSNFLSAGSQNRSRSKSPGRRVEEEPKRKPSRSKRSESDSDDVSDTPQYEERTPEAYLSRTTSRDDRKPAKKPSGEVTRKRSTKHEDMRGRREKDSHDHVPMPQPTNGQNYGYNYQDHNAQPPNQGYNFQDRNYAQYTGHAEPPGAFPNQSANRQYAEVDKFQYAQPDQNFQYNYNQQQQYSQQQYGQPQYNPAQNGPVSAVQRGYPDDRYNGPGSNSQRDSSPEGRKRRQSFQRERSPNPGTSELRKSLNRLSTAGAGGMLSAVMPQAHTSGGRPPASPLLESYKGTYQTISPLPSPLALAVVRRNDDDLSDFDLSEDGDSDDEIAKEIRALKLRKQHMSGHDSHTTASPRSSGTKLEAPSKKSRVSSVASGKDTKKRGVSFYDPAADAEKIADGLKGNHRTPDLKPLLKILPWLTTDEIIHLKTEYKNFAKVNGQGINLSKHIKARKPSGNLGKILYATSLGQYESDAYWANCFYQSNGSRRELLIESLIGRTNQQIREIKDVFKDKRYDDDLEKCMKAELKADKFRAAILLALEERRQPEGLGLDMRRVHEDGTELYQALVSPGGETAMIRIVMLRSDDHLKEVLRYYEKSFRRNFAKDMLSKSQNLVVS